MSPFAVDGGGVPFGSCAAALDGGRHTVFGSGGGLGRATRVNGLARFVGHGVTFLDSSGSVFFDDFFAPRDIDGFAFSVGSCAFVGFGDAVLGFLDAAASLVAASPLFPIGSSDCLGTASLEGAVTGSGSIVLSLDCGGLSFSIGSGAFVGSRSAILGFFYLAAAFIAASSLLPVGVGDRFRTASLEGAVTCSGSIVLSLDCGGLSFSIGSGSFVGPSSAVLGSLDVSTTFIAPCALLASGVGSSAAATAFEIPAAVPSPGALAANLAASSTSVGALALIAAQSRALSS